MPITKADLDDGFARVSRTFMFVLSCMELSAAELEIAMQCAIYAWARNLKEPGYQSGLWRAKLVEIFEGIISRTQVYEAVNVLLARGVVIDTSDGLEINPRAGERLSPEKRALAERMKSIHDRFLATPIERQSGKPDKKSGKPDEKSGKPDGEIRESAKEEAVGTQNAILRKTDLISSSSLTYPSKSGYDEPADDDEPRQGFKKPNNAETELITQAKLFSSLAICVSRIAGQKPKDELMRELASIRGFELSRINAAAAAILFALRNDTIKRVKDLRSLLVHAIQNPENYEPATPEQAMQEKTRPAPTGQQSSALEEQVAQAQAERLKKLAGGKTA